MFPELLNASLDLGLGKPILWREIVGNGFGLASAILGMRRRVAAWPIGIVGNVLLFTVFLGGVFQTPQQLDLWGQAGRQVFFFLVSVYGWIRWFRFRQDHTGGSGVEPRWASWRERGALLMAALSLLLISYFAMRALNSYGPLADAFILTGSILATYGMARGYLEFWLIWIAVDAVGVPLLWQAQYYPSALLYLVYGAFCALGFITWLRLRKRLNSENAGESISTTAPA